MWVSVSPAAVCIRGALHPVVFELSSLLITSCTSFPYFELFALFLIFALPDVTSFYVTADKIASAVVKNVRINWKGFFSGATSGNIWILSVSEFAPFNDLAIGLRNNWSLSEMHMDDGKLLTHEEQ